MESILDDLPTIGGYRDLLCRDLSPPQSGRRSIFDIPDSDPGSVAEDCPSPATDIQSDDDDDSTMDDRGDLLEAGEGEDWGNTEETNRADSKHNPGESAPTDLSDLEKVIDCTTELDVRVQYIENSWKQQRPWNASTQQSLKAAQEENGRLRTSLEKLEKQVDILWKERGVGLDGSRKAGRPKRKAPSGLTSQ